MIFFIFAMVSVIQGLTDVPTIGILTQPRNDIEGGKTEFIDAHYPIYLGGSGAKIIPLSYSLPEKNMTELLSKLNGVLVTGGTADFAIYNEDTKKYEMTPFGKAGKFIIETAKRMNDNDDYFPIWGTCMGFQLLAFVISGDPEIPKKGCNCSNYNAALLFTQEGRTSKMFSIFSKDEMRSFEERGLTYNNHRYYVDSEDFSNHKELRDTFNILAYSTDIEKKRVFISAMEGKKYPFYGTQFHPEVNQYSKAKRIPGPENVKLAQMFANFFVNETRKSNHNLEDYLNITIWNTPITRLKENDFVYLFNNK